MGFQARHIILLLGVLLLAGCAALRMDFEAPDVKVVSLRMLPAEGMEQRLAIGLRISNPNEATLNLVGMKYSLRVEGYDLVSGVTRDIPPMAGYTETPVEIIASLNWINSLRLMQELLAAPQNTVNYELDAKLDPGQFQPAFHVLEQGAVQLLPAN